MNYGLSRCLKVSWDSLQIIKRHWQRFESGIYMEVANDFDSQRYGDWFVWKPDGRVVKIEIKAEERMTGNLFLETWSDFPKRLGWIHTSEADQLWYHFLDTGYLFRVPMKATQEWFTRNRTNYPEVLQKKTEQHNRAKGLLAPWPMLQEIGLVYEQIR